MSTSIMTAPDHNQEALEKIKQQYLALQESIEGKEMAAKKKGEIEIALKLVDSVDNCDRAIEAIRVSSNDQAAVYGLELLRNNLLDTFTAIGFQPFGVNGEIFDPRFHEALTVESGYGEPNQILKVVKRGWIYEKKMIRPASVIILRSLGPAPTGDPVITPGVRRRKRHHVDHTEDGGSVS